MRTKTSQHLI